MVIDINESNKSEVAVKHRNKWLQLLFETVSDLVAATDSKQMMQDIFQKVSSYLECDIFFSYTATEDENGQCLSLEASGGIDAATKNAFGRLEFGQGVCGTSAHLQQSIIIENLQNTTDSKADGLRKLGIRAYACQPLMHGNTLLGTLSFASRLKNRFEPQKHEFITTLGYYIALAKMRIITECNTRRNEELLREALEEKVRQAKTASIAKSEFLANMSHEIRTPMNAIVGLTHLLDQREMPEAKRKEAFRVMKFSSGQLMDLIDNILDISKIESEQLIFEQIAFNLHTLCEEIISINTVKATEKQLALNINYVSLPDRFIIGDPLRFKQVLLNLVGNAVKFTEKGGVTVKVTSLPAEMEETIRIQIDVIDSGIGIKKEYKESIFTKFSQGDASMTRKYGGSGLGLVISKKLIDAMKGTITFQSAYGQGSHFILTIPFRLATQI